MQSELQLAVHAHGEVLVAGGDGRMSKMTSLPDFAVSSTTSSDGTMLAYRTAGNTARRPLVLVHGWAQSSGSWGSAVLAELAEDFYVIAVDLRGHGHSEVAEAGYDSSEQWAEDLAAVLDAAEVTDENPALVLGWSYGGIVVSDYLGHYGTHRVAGLVLCGAATSLSGSRGGLVGPDMLEVIDGATSENPRRAIAALARFGASMMRGIDGPAQQRFFGQALVTPPRVRAALLRRRVDNEVTLRSLDVPALVIHGAVDGVVLPAAGQANAEMIPNSSYVEFDNCAHAPFVEAPGRFLAELRGFAAGL